MLDAAAGLLPAVVLRADAYLSQGMMGADVLANLITAAHAKELYVILDVNAADPAPWLSYGADAVTVCPYAGSDCLSVPEDRLAIAAVRTGNPSGGTVQTLMAGDRALWLSLAEQMARRGAALSVATGYSLDVRDVRRCCPTAFLLLRLRRRERPGPPLTTSATGRCSPMKRCNTPPIPPPRRRPWPR